MTPALRSKSVCLVRTTCPFLCQVYLGATSSCGYFNPRLMEPPSEVLGPRGGSLGTESDPFKGSQTNSQKPIKMEFWPLCFCRMEREAVRTLASFSQTRFSERQAPETVLGLLGQLPTLLPFCPLCLLTCLTYLCISPETTRSPDTGGRERERLFSKSWGGRGVGRNGAS